MHSPSGLVAVPKNPPSTLKLWTPEFPWGTLSGDGPTSPGRTLWTEIWQSVGTVQPTCEPDCCATVICRIPDGGGAAKVVSGMRIRIQIGRDLCNQRRRQKQPIYKHVVGGDEIRSINVRVLKHRTRPMTFGPTDVTVGSVAVTIVTRAVDVTDVSATEVAVTEMELGEGAVAGAVYTPVFGSIVPSVGDARGKRPGHILAGGIGSEHASRIVHGGDKIVEGFAGSNCNGRRRNGNADAGDDRECRGGEYWWYRLAAVAVMVAVGVTVEVPLVVTVGRIEGAV